MIPPELQANIKQYFDNKTVLITGGTGSFGKHFAMFLLRHTRVKKVIIYSRDEFKQHEMKKSTSDDRVRYFIGDVRDRKRLSRALKGVNVVLHTAALKHVSVAEYNPDETIKTNIIGTLNVIEACNEHANTLDACIFLSTDKAVNPINLYGGTKFVAEKLWVDANYFSPIFSVVRYGNVMGSRGSVLPLFQDLYKQGTKEFPITDEAMTRFWMSLDDAMETVFYALLNTHKWPGCIYVKKAYAFKITKLIKAIYLRAQYKQIGIQPGEKLHEMLITTQEGQRCFDVTKGLENIIAIKPFDTFKEGTIYPVTPYENIYPYVSDRVIHLSVNEIKALIEEAK